MPLLGDMHCMIQRILEGNTVMDPALKHLSKIRKSEVCMNLLRYSLDHIHMFGTLGVTSILALPSIQRTIL